MNIHPLFVHFPIGLLVVYSVLELGAYFWPKLRRQTWLFPVNAFLLFVGTLGAFAALITGGIAEELIEGSSRGYILEVHSPVAGATTVLYLILAAAYVVRIFQVKGWGNQLFGSTVFAPVLRLKEYLAHLVLDTWLLPALALLALVGMTVTGALGAAIVYGPNADPFVAFVYHWFWAQ
jgi:uncharacterized membrane protein